MVEKIKAWLKENNLDERDVVIGIGLLMIGIGCGLIYLPVAFIVVGVGLFGLGTGMIKIK
jgi:cyanate permease